MWLLLALWACGGATEPAPQAPEVAQAPAAPAAPAEPVAPPAAVADPVAAIQGHWSVALTPEKQAEIQAMKLALADPPPSVADIEAMGLDPKAERTVKLILLSRSQEGGMTDDVRQRLLAQADRTVTITATEVVLGQGPMAQRSTYTVDTVKGSTVHITSMVDSTRRSATLELVGPDTLRLTQGTGAQRTMELVRAEPSP